MNIKYTKSAIFPEIVFEPKKIHYESLDLAKYLFRSALNREISEKSKDILKEWVYHLDEQGLKALDYIVRAYFKKNESVEQGVCFITTICAWFCANIEYLEFLEKIEKKYA